eukprot:TRINITY_DN901_c0_g1_i1.p1 TRINITY_DN901_c0_g1~~TRINITY_DN901_c0_g1_i1.p1  ORF type:complete len:159 (-),score=32.15 TRINITY_DN901_c0_g1_i1:409-885(-)
MSSILDDHAAACPQLIGKEIECKLRICRGCNKFAMKEVRLKRCNHLCCKDCADKTNFMCPLCQLQSDGADPVKRNAHVCQHCARAYWSEASLQEHIKIRHQQPPPQPPQNAMMHMQQQHPPMGMGMQHPPTMHMQHQQPPMSYSMYGQPQHNPAMNRW